MSELANQGGAEMRLAAQLAVDPYKKLLLLLPAAVYTTDAEGRINFYNGAAAELWGRMPTLGEDLWCGSWKIFSPDGEPVPLDQCPMAIALKESRPVFGQEIVVERPDGRRAIVHPFPQPLYDDEGQVIGACNMLVDVTERKLREDELRESQDRLAAVFRQAAVGMALLSRDGRFLEVNARLCDLLGAPGVELQCMTLLDVTHPTEKGVWSQILEHADPLETVREARWIGEDGQNVWVNVAVSQLTGTDNLIAVVEDISARKQAEMELQELAKSLESRVVSRTSELEALCYSIAHDLRQHIRGVSINAHLLAEGIEAGDPNVHFNLQRLASAAKHMDTLVADLLGYANRSRQELKKVPVDVTAMASDVAQALCQSHSCEVQIQPDMKASADPALLGVVLSNLLDNACKYSPADSDCRIEVGFQNDSFFVRDHGIGFDMAYAHKLFEPFQRLHRHADIPGTGIGLASVAQIIERHGGEVWASSKPGEGSTFYFTLPD